MDCIVTIVVVFVIVLIVGWWVLGAYTLIQPVPQRADTNFDSMIDEFLTYPSELWFRNNPCVFKKNLKGTCRRYVVLESDGKVVYDSQPVNPRGRGYWLKAYKIPGTVEYQKAAVTLTGYITRNNTANMCRAVANGSRYRMVHVSEYVFTFNDPEF